MTPFASVAMLEKLALLKIARCRAPAFSSTSSACWRKIAPAPLDTPFLDLVASFPLAMGSPLAVAWSVMMPCAQAAGRSATAHRKDTLSPEGALPLPRKGEREQLGPCAHEPGRS